MTELLVSASILHTVFFGCSFGVNFISRLNASPFFFGVTMSEPSTHPTFTLRNGGIVPELILASVMRINSSVFPVCGLGIRFSI